ncbi:hypothetical protein NKH18_23750 [Streptomyces sp. M10(2022)]
MALRSPGHSPVTLRIAPKVPVARLFFLIGYASNPTSTGTGGERCRAGRAASRAGAGIREVLERALRQGVLQGYRHTEEAAPVVRGRIREADQVRRHHGRAFPVEVAYDDYGTDIAENRLLRAAAERLLTLPRAPDRVRRRLRHHRGRLLDAQPLIPGSRDLPLWRASRLNLRYQPALRLAEMVLRGLSVEHLSGRITIDGYLFDTHKIFEDFVCTALREALAQYGAQRTSGAGRTPR